MSSVFNGNPCSPPGFFESKAMERGLQKVPNLTQPKSITTTSKEPQRNQCANKRLRQGRLGLSPKAKSNEVPRETMCRAAV
jgi:hypothetical protein